MLHVRPHRFCVRVNGFDKGIKRNIYDFLLVNSFKFLEIYFNIKQVYHFTENCRFVGSWTCSRTEKKLALGLGSLQWPIHRRCNSIFGPSISDTFRTEKKTNRQRMRGKSPQRTRKTISSHHFIYSSHQKDMYKWFERKRGRLWFSIEFKAFEHRDNSSTKFGCRCGWSNRTVFFR